MVLLELSCRAAAEFPPLELFVRWSTKSLLCSDWRGVGKWEVIFNWALKLTGLFGNCRWGTFRKAYLTQIIM